MKFIAFINYCLKSDRVLLVALAICIQALLSIVAFFAIPIWVIPVGIYQYRKWVKENNE